LQLPAPFAVGGQLPADRLVSTKPQQAGKARDWPQATGCIQRRDRPERDKVDI